MSKKCEEISGILPWYVNGNLDPVEMRIVTGHIAECAECRSELAFTVKMQKAAGSLCHKPDDAIKADVLGKIIDQISKEEVQTRKISRRYAKLFEEAARNLSPFGIVAAAVYTMRGLISEKVDVIKQELEPVVDGMTVYKMFCEKVIENI